jgi:glycine/D-amino acid oxidase-like deaminating enzyme
MPAIQHTSERIVVVGGGFAGLAVAVRLAQAGLPVTVLEAVRIGFEASTPNQGWLHSGAWFAPQHALLARRCHLALQQTLQFCPQCIEPRHDGMLYLMARPESNPRSWTDAWQASAIPFQTLPIDELHRRMPELTPESIRQAYLLPDRAFRPEILLEHLEAAARNAGAEVRTQTPVTGLLRDEQAVYGVITGSGEELRARLVILATGAQSGRYWSEAMTPVAGRQVAWTRVLLKTHLVAVRPAVGDSPFCVIDRDGFNHLPHAGTSVLGTSRWPVVRDPEDRRVEPEETARIWRQAEQLLPGLDRARCREVLEWAGTTVQAMRYDQIAPGEAPLPVLIDHRGESPSLRNLWSVYPGRATLWADVAEQARQKALDEFGARGHRAATPPWGV